MDKCNVLGTLGDLRITANGKDHAGTQDNRLVGVIDIVRLAIGGKHPERLERAAS